MDTKAIPSKSALLTARRLKALQLRLAGASYRTISLSNGCTLSMAFADVRAMLKEYATQPVEEVRHAEVARLDRLLLAHWPSAIQGNKSATDTVLAIMDRRARLLGLDAPRKVDITGWIREMAVREGFDPGQAVVDADNFVRALPA